MAAPVTRTCVEPLGRHDQESGLFKRHGVRLSAPILTREDANVEVLKPSAPALNQLISKRSQWGEVNCTRAIRKRRSDRLLGEPRLASSGGHLKDGAEPARQKAMLNHGTLSRVQMLLAFKDLPGQHSGKMLDMPMKVHDNVR
jgi:hypothetical protein